MKFIVYKMYCLGNVIFTRCIICKMSYTTKCIVYEMSCLWNVFSMKCIVYEMYCLGNVIFTRCIVCKMSYLRNVLSMKCHVYKMYCLSKSQPEYMWILRKKSRMWAHKTILAIHVGIISVIISESIIIHYFHLSIQPVQWWMFSWKINSPPRTFENYFAS